MSGGIPMHYHQLCVAVLVNILEKTKIADVLNSDNIKLWSTTFMEVVNFKMDMVKVYI